MVLQGQAQGEAIIRTLHNATAAVAAAAPDANDDVSAEKTFGEICVGYEAHHYFSDSNSLHSAGMILGFGLLAAALAVGEKLSYC